MRPSRREEARSGVVKAVEEKNLSWAEQLAIEPTRGFK
jgi:hypothetical protein